MRVNTSKSRVDFVATYGNDTFEINFEDRLPQVSASAQNVKRKLTRKKLLSEIRSSDKIDAESLSKEGLSIFFKLNS